MPPMSFVFRVFNGAERFEPSRYIAIDFKPSRQPSMYVFMISSTVTRFRHVDCFRNGAAQKRLRRRHHAQMRHVA